ncbi:acetyltransferase (GNAT) family domain-containing protein [Ditylenchus destructor]|nr:acetyltransferase (GNAT) family domain-containing protein [Ditylenchus destructor]
MLERLRQFLAEKYRFRIPIRADVLPRCTIRLLEEKDFATCESIYLLNEPGRFPQGLFPHFADWLRNGKTLMLIAEVDGQIRGFGGVNAQEEDGKHFVWLSFGMVHPDHHRTGFGTTLLLARLALAESRHDRCTALLTTTGAPKPFTADSASPTSRATPGRMATRVTPTSPS